MSAIPFFINVRHARAPRTIGSVVAAVRSVRTWVALSVIVTGSFLVRTASSLAHPAPTYFPDEYIYGALARSIAEGKLTIRGVPAHFPALLEPLLAAPFWLAGDIGVAYRLTLVMHALAMSIAIVPVYFLARLLALKRWQALGAATFTASLPSLVYTSYLTADAVAFPLALNALCLAVMCLVRPTGRRQVGFVALAGLASLARVQYVILIPAFCGAAIVCNGGNPLHVLLRFRVMVATLTGSVVLAFAGGLLSLGYYRSVLDLAFDPVGLLHWAAVDLMLLAYAAGWVLVPGALVGLALALTRPLSQAERAFAALIAFYMAFLLGEAALYASNGSERFQERYLITLLPLIPIAFSLWARRLPVASRPAAVIAIVLLGISAVVPVSGYLAGTGKQDSPFLSGVFYFTGELGSYGAGALLVAGIAAALTGVALAAVAVPRIGVPLALGGAIVVSAVCAAGAVAHDHEIAQGVREQLVPAQASWIDKAVDRPVTVLIAPGNLRPIVSEHLFWNARLQQVAVMAGADPVDSFSNLPAGVRENGLLSIGGKTATGPVLVEEYGSTVELQDASVLSQGGTARLWRPNGPIRLSVLGLGRFFDGWWTTRSGIVVWPRLDGRVDLELRMTMWLPRKAVHAVRLRIAGAGRDDVVALAPGERRQVRIPLVIRRTTRLSLTVVGAALELGNRPVSVMSTRPTVIPTPNSR